MWLLFIYFTIIFYCRVAIFHCWRWKIEGFYSPQSQSQHSAYLHQWHRYFLLNPPGKKKGNINTRLLIYRGGNGSGSHGGASCGCDDGIFSVEKVLFLCTIFGDGRKKKKKTIQFCSKPCSALWYLMALTMVHFRQTCGRYSTSLGLLGYAIGFNLFHFTTESHAAKVKLNSVDLTEFS